MSFVLLMLALYAFQLVAAPANELAAEAELKDVANRVASGVLELSDVGAKRAASIGGVESSEVLFRKEIGVPGQIRGQQYTVTLTNGEVTAASFNGLFSAKAPTFNLQGGSCAASTPVCSLGGTLNPTGRILIKYEYKASGVPTTATCASAPVLNCISIS